MLGKKIIRINKTFASNGPGMINEAKAFILETLKGLKIGRKLVMKTELLCEETIIDLMRFSAEGASLNVRIRRFFGDLSVVLSMDGEEYDPETHTRKVTRVKKLYDVSAVDIPAYEETSLTARKSFEAERAKEIEKLEYERRRKLLIAMTLI